MKQNRGYPQLTVTKRAEHSIIKGHPWVYYNEITAEQPFADGELVDVVSQKGSYLGTGFANSNSKIRVRLISRNANDRFDEAFFERREQWPLKMPADAACRSVDGGASTPVKPGRCGQTPPSIHISRISG